MPSSMNVQLYQEQKRKSYNFFMHNSISQKPNLHISFGFFASIYCLFLCSANFEYTVVIVSPSHGNDMAMTFNDVSGSADEHRPQRQQMALAQTEFDTQQTVGPSAEPIL